MCLCVFNFTYLAIGGTKVATTKEKRLMAPEYPKDEKEFLLKRVIGNGEVGLRRL